MRRNLMIFTILAGLSGSAFAETITTTVNGMGCAFCATGIEKTFRKQPEVATINVDLPKKLVTITTKPGKTLSDAKIKEVVTENENGENGVRGEWSGEWGQSGLAPFCRTVRKG